MLLPLAPPLITRLSERMRKRAAQIRERATPRGNADSHVRPEDVATGKKSDQRTSPLRYRGRAPRERVVQSVLHCLGEEVVVAFFSHEQKQVLGSSPVWTREILIRVPQFANFIAL